MRVPRQGTGRTKQCSKELTADKAYDSKRLRRWLARRGSSYRRSLPTNGEPKEAAPAGPSHDGQISYAEHWKVERTFALLGNFPRLLAQHEYYLSTFSAFFPIAFIIFSGISKIA